MPFANGTVSTNSLKRTLADRLQTTPTRNSPKFVAIGTGATAAARTAAAADAALSTEVESRASGTESTVTITNTGDTYQVVGTVTATATRTVDEAMTVDAASAGNIGISATISPTIGLQSGDSLQLTFREQLT
jgi:hypothetical protein